ncbi:MAG: hypothetical protein QM784_40710, partial [Polyangiaceae bacterium]
MRELRATPTTFACHHVKHPVAFRFISTGYAGLDASILAAVGITTWKPWYSVRNVTQCPYSGTGRVKRSMISAVRIHRVLINL